MRSSDAFFYNAPSIAKRSDHRNLRCAPQLGQEPSRLQLNAKKVSGMRLIPHRSHRNPCLRRPHFGYSSKNSRST